MAYRIGGRAVIRFTADSHLRSLYLRSRAASADLRELAGFFRVKAALEACSDVVAQFSIGQRLDLFVQPKLSKLSGVDHYDILQSVLVKIERLAINTP
jgi:hypothetical protein